MTVYSFYIFDRHTECIYSKSWLPPSQAAPPPTTPANPDIPTAVPIPNTMPIPAPVDPVNPVPVPAAAATVAAAAAAAAPKKAQPNGSSKATSRAQNDAKLIFGTVFSLRNMVRKLGGEGDAFISYRTAQYRLHYYETPTNLRFVMLTDTATMSMRNVLHQIYINLWVEYVVKNPLAPVEHKGGEGVKNELFQMGLDQFIRGLQ